MASKKKKSLLSKVLVIGGITNIVNFNQKSDKSKTSE